MAERRGWHRAVGSVRVRITFLATVVFAVAFTVGAVVLVRAVRGSLEDRVRDDNRVALQSLADQVEGLVEIEPLPHHLVAEVEQIGDLLVPAISLPRRRRDNETPAGVAVDDGGDLADLVRIGNRRAAELARDVVHTPEFCAAANSPSCSTPNRAWSD